MSKLKGNKGEWSEIYVFLKVLGDGRIYGADADLNRNEELFYDIWKIIRDEGDGEADYVTDENNGKVCVFVKDRKVAEVVSERFTEESAYLLKSIIEGKGAFGVERTEEFMDALGCHKLKAPSKDKTDIRMQVHDPSTCTDPILGFSIKSDLGNFPTLINAGCTTNFVYKLTGNMDDALMNAVNGISKTSGNGGSKSDIKGRMDLLKSRGIGLEFDRMESDTYEANLRLIDTSLPEIVAEMLKIFYLEGEAVVSEQVRIMSERDPVGYGRKGKQPFYAYKIKKFLTESAVGMNPGRVWDGISDANGGYIVVREDGEVLCYHLYNRNDFEDYLLKHTKTDKASTSRYGHASVEKDVYGSYTMKLNLQVRFF